jgi:transcriptional regulator with XRE-family HTH domain
MPTRNLNNEDLEPRIVASRDAEHADVRLAIARLCTGFCCPKWTISEIRNGGRQVITEEAGSIAAIVRNARTNKGLSQPELARRVGTTQQTIDKIESGIVKHSRFLPAIAVELGVSLDRVLRFRHKESGVAAIAGHTLVSGDRDLPVYAATQGGSGVQILSSDPVEYVLRPEPLARVRDSYGVIVVDDTMAPEARSGDVALVNPHVPPRVGDTCVFRSTPRDGGGIHSSIRHLRKVTERDWHVTEWNNDGERRDYTLKRSDWPVAHVTIGFFKRR